MLFIFMPQTYWKAKHNERVQVNYPWIISNDKLLLQKLFYESLPNSPSYSFWWSFNITNTINPFQHPSQSKPVSTIVSNVTSHQHPKSHSTLHEVFTKKREREHNLYYTYPETQKRSFFHQRKTYNSSTSNSDRSCTIETERQDRYTSLILVAISLCDSHRNTGDHRYSI